MKSEESNEINETEDNIENKDSKDNIESEKKQETEEQIKTIENQDFLEKSNSKLNKSKEIKTTEAPPSIGEKIFIIDDVEYFYTIDELENKDGIYIKLEEVKPKNNIYFLLEISTKELLEKIKFFCCFDDNQQRINYLCKLFNNNRCKVIKKEEKYFLVLLIEIIEFNIETKVEIELIRIEIYEQANNNLISNVKYLNDIVKELKSDINELKKVKISAESGDSKIIESNNIDMNTFIEEAIKKIDIKNKVIEALKGQEFQNIQNKPINNNINIIDEKKENNNLENIISEKIKVSINELINEKFKKKEEDEKLVKERIDNIENNINDKFNKINQIIEKLEKEKINELSAEKLKNYQEDMVKQKEQIDKLENDTNAKFVDVNKLIEKLEKEKINELIKKEFTKTEEGLKNIIKNNFDSYNNKITQEINNIKDDNTKKLLPQLNNIINENKNSNYIKIKLNIDKNIIGSEIRLLRQHEIYKRKFNFEIDDIIVQINDKNIPILFNNINNSYSYETEKIYQFNWSFNEVGTYVVKIIFKKPLSYCNYLFSDCKYITCIDCSHFDCSEVRECCYMFSGCSALKKIIFGKLDFSLVTNFSYMFYNCSEISELDISGFNTKNAKYFNNLFNGCKKLKKIDISNFNTSSCQQIDYMFYGCVSITEVDMIKWDMTNISSMTYLFSGCSSLAKIKMSMNFKSPDNVSKNNIFKGIPDSGEFYYLKKKKCKAITDLLSTGWDILIENQ